MERAGRWTDEWWKKKKKEDAINGNRKRENERENERASCGKKEANDQRRSGGCRKRYDGGGDYKGMEHTSCKVHLSPRFGCGGRHFDRVFVFGAGSRASRMRKWYVWVQGRKGERTMMSV